METTETASDDSNTSFYKIYQYKKEIKGDGEYLVSYIDARHGWLKRRAEFEQAVNLRLLWTLS